MAHNGHYAKYGHKDFVVALGYKAEVIKEYFLNYHALNSDFSVDLKSGTISTHSSNVTDWRVTLVDTGLDTMTGGRVKRLEPYIGNEPFLLTYGDGVADIEINDLIEFHKNHGKTVTLSAVRPTARFGDLQFDGDRVSSFKEKPQIHSGWVNGGFFVCQPELMEYISGDAEMLEREPFERVVQDGELMAFKHEGSGSAWTLNETGIFLNRW